MKYFTEKGIEFSKIGLGTGRFGTRVSEKLSYQMLDYFLEQGGNVIDTARNYYEWVENGRGKSEETIGKWMSLRKCRDDVRISTKGGVRNEGKTFIVNLSKEALTKEVHESLSALQTDHVDIYLLHRDEPERAVGEIMETLQGISELAKPVLLGVSNWAADRVKSANDYARKHNMREIEVVQTWWSIASYTPEMWNDDTTTYMDEQMYEYLLKEQKIGMAYTSQAKGFFQKAIKNGYENVDEFLKKRIATQSNRKKLQEIDAYCLEKNVSPTGVVSGYITDNPLKGIALVSCSSIEQLQDIMCHCDEQVEKDFIEKMRGTANE